MGKANSKNDKNELYDEKLLKFIPVEKIQPNPYNDFPMEEMDSLEATIKAFGILTPLLLVGPFKDDEYLIINGERRYRIATKLWSRGDERFSKVPCYIPEKSMSDNRQQLVMEIANIEHRNTNDENRTKRMFKIYRILNEMELSGNIHDREIAKMAASSLNCSTRYMRIFKSMYKNSTESLRDLVYQGTVSVKNANIFSSYTPEEQEEYVERVKMGERPVDIARELKEKEKKEREEPEKAVTEDVITSPYQINGAYKGTIPIDIEAFKKALMSDEYDPFGFTSGRSRKENHTEESDYNPYVEEYLEGIDVENCVIEYKEENFYDRNLSFAYKFKEWCDAICDIEVSLSEAEKEIVEYCSKVAEIYGHLID